MNDSEGRCEKFSRSGLRFLYRKNAGFSAAFGDPICRRRGESTVNVSVATTVTATLGVAITKICEEYTKACIENGGSKDLMITKISDYFTVENLKKVMKEISKGKDQKIVERIVKAVVDMFKDTKKGARK